MPFPVRLPPPATAAAAAAAAVLAAVALRRYLSSHPRPSTSTTTSAHRSSEATILVLSGKSPQDQQLLASAAGSLDLGEGEAGGGEITVSLASDAPADGFDAGAYMGALRARRFGRWMLWSPKLASTHDLVAQNFAKLPVGVVCVADVQFKGRGRSKNVWESPPGCLMFSFTSQMGDVQKLPLMQYVVCLAMTEAIKELCCAKGLPELDVRIKWPNDLYLKGLKVGGILCTSSYQPKIYNICTGIGLNVDNEKPTTCLNAALQEVKANSPRLKREDILASFFNKFEVLFEVFSNQGFQALGEQYYNSWLHSDQRVIVQDVHEGQSVDSVVTIQGLTPTGYLYAIGEDGKSYELHPDGNRCWRAAHLLSIAKIFLIHHPDASIPTCVCQECNGPSHTILVEKSDTFSCTAALISSKDW